MSISKETVKKVAALARLRLSEAEEEKYSGQLSSILSYVDQLKSLPASGEVDLFGEAHHDLDELRDDQTDGGRYQEKILELAPEARNDQIVVPEVFE